MNKNVVLVVVSCGIGVVSCLVGCVCQVCCVLLDPCDDDRRSFREHDAPGDISDGLEGLTKISERPAGERKGSDTKT